MKQIEEQTAGALHQIQPGGPITFVRLVLQADPGNDTDCVVYCTSQSTVELRGTRVLADTR